MQVPIADGDLGFYDGGMRDSLLFLLLALPLTSSAYRLTDADRQSSNVIDCRDGGALERCQKAEENLKRECIAAFDKIGVESKVTAVGFNPGIDAGLANYGDTEARLRAQRERCIQQYALSNQVCEESESHIAANKQCMDQGVGPISSVREVRSNLTNLYNTGDRKFDSSWGALQNAKVILNKMREPTSAQAPSN